MASSFFDEPPQDRETCQEPECAIEPAAIGNGVEVTAENQTLFRCSLLMSPNDFPPRHNDVPRAILRAWTRTIFALAARYRSRLIAGPPLRQRSVLAVLSAVPGFRFHSPAC